MQPNLDRAPEARAPAVADGELVVPGTAPLAATETDGQPQVESSGEDLDRQKPMHTLAVSPATNGATQPQENKSAHKQGYALPTGD